MVALLPLFWGFRIQCYPIRKLDKFGKIFPKYTHFYSIHEILFLPQYLNPCPLVPSKLMIYILCFPKIFLPNLTVNIALYNPWKSCVLVKCAKLCLCNKHNCRSLWFNVTTAEIQCVSTESFIILDTG